MWSKENDFEWDLFGKSVNTNVRNTFSELNCQLSLCVVKWWKSKGLAIPIGVMII